MLKLFVVFLLAVAAQTLGDSVTDGTKLISAFLVHRHGDRTPVPASVELSTDPEALEAASAKYGYGQLTNLGKQRAYGLGKFIRARYDELLAPQYNKSEIYIRSTDSTRTKMTVLTAMAAVYPSYPGSWSDEIDWVPTPYTTVPLKYDYNEASLNCPNFITAYESLTMSNSPRMTKYSSTLAIVSEQLGFDLSSMPVMISAVYDVYISQEHLGVPLPDNIAAIMDDIKAATDEAVDITLGNDAYIAYQAGPLLNEFFTYADQQINGTDTPHVRIYSAHDFNVYSLMAVAQITPRQGAPKYASAFSLELRQVEETGKLVVLPVYQPAPGEDLMYLPVAGCDSLLCPYDTYKNIVSSYLLDEDTWRTKCGFTEDIVIDDSSVN